MYVPAPVVTVLNETPVPSLVSVTVAPGITAPDASVTTPSTRDVVPCASAAATETSQHTTTTHTTLRTIQTSQDTNGVERLRDAVDEYA